MDDNDLRQQRAYESQLLDSTAMLKKQADLISAQHYVLGRKAGYLSLKAQIYLSTLGISVLTIVVTVLLILLIKYSFF